MVEVQRTVLSGGGRRKRQTRDSWSECMRTECTTSSTLGESTPCAATKVVLTARRHALALRQCKLAFPQVHLMVGVMSDELCVAHKSGPVMTHAERCESIRHCRWVDEVLPDGPWVVDQEWMDKHQIDYIAHDEEVYPAKGHQDVYQFVKEQGDPHPLHHSSKRLTCRFCRPIRSYSKDTRNLHFGPARTNRPRVSRWVFRFQAREEWPV